jgi:hypothetical protein
MPFYKEVDTVKMIVSFSHSLIATAKLNHLNAYEYLRKICQNNYICQIGRRYRRLSSLDHQALTPDFFCRCQGCASISTDVFSAYVHNHAAEPFIIFGRGGIYYGEIKRGDRCKSIPPFFFK